MSNKEKAIQLLPFLTALILASLLLLPVAPETQLMQEKESAQLPQRPI